MKVALQQISVSTLRLLRKNRLARRIAIALPDPRRLTGVRSRPP